MSSQDGLNSVFRLAQKNLCSTLKYLYLLEHDFFTSSASLFVCIFSGLGKVSFIFYWNRGFEVSLKGANGWLSWPNLLWFMTSETFF